MQNVKITTSLGNITIELNDEKAPNTALNFLEYVKSGFYNGTIFHRIIPGFMIQGGGFEPGMQEKDTSKPIKHEGENGLKNLRGTIAMARTNDPHSATSQFFINTADNGFLDYIRPGGQGWGYTVFGRVIEGMDVVDEIESVTTCRRMGHDDVPFEDVIIEKIELI